jgi:putative phosphoribosyl transferase
VFESIRIRLQLRFKNRVCAASLLAESLRDVIKKEKATIKNNILILGIPRGGVITADVIAEKINAAAPNFDIVIPRRLAAPHNEELAIGAVMEDGSTYLDEHLIKVLEIQSKYLEKVKKEQIDEIRRRSALYRRPGLDYKINSKTTVILADDGAATGATIIAAARWIRKTHNPKQLIIALPITPKDTVSLLKKEADHVEVITSPSTPSFRSVGQYYQDFNPVTDEQVIGIMRRRDGPLT